MPVLSERLAGSGRDVPGRVRREPALLPEPGEHPHRQLLAHHPRLPAGPAVRPVRVVPRRLDARDVAARRRLPNGAVRQVPRWLPALGGDRLRPARLGPMGGVRALGAGGLHPDDRRGAARGSDMVRTTTRPRCSPTRPSRSCRTRPGRCSWSSPPRRRTPRRSRRPATRTLVRRPAAGAAAVVRRGRRLRQAGVGPRPPPFTASQEAAIDAFRADQYRSLLGVDRAVGRVLDALETRRAAREHADRVHLGQRDPARRAPVDQEGGAVRGGRSASRS